MSHFTVLVMGNDPEQLLAPYHEFECTGRNDEYVQDIENTDEQRAEYERATDTMLALEGGGLVPMFGRDGNYNELYMREVSREEAEKRYGAFDHRVKTHPYASDKRLIWDPPAHEEIELATSKLRTFVAHLEEGGYSFIKEGGTPDYEGAHKFQYAVVDDDWNVLRTYDRTNPNKKWDYYVLGGRWSGFFRTKQGESTDQALKGEIDFDKKAANEVARLLVKFNRALELKGDHPTESWLTIRERHKSVEKAREVYNAQPAVQAWSRDRELDHNFQCCMTWFANFDRDEFIRRTRLNANAPFALITPDGKWHERGEMGWWGIVTNGKDREHWSETVKRLIDRQPDDMLFSLYDCHI